LLVGGRRSRIDRSGIELLNRPRPTQGCRVDRRRRRNIVVVVVVVVVIDVDIRPYVRVEAIKKHRLVPPLSIFRICSWPLAGSPTTYVSILCRAKVFSSSPKRPHWLWGPPRVL